MKKIIRGRLYDTETAKEVGSWEAEVSRSDFNWYEETLYRRRPGNSSSPEMADRQVSTQNALTVAGSAEAASNRSHTKMRVNGLKDT